MEEQGVKLTKTIWGDEHKAKLVCYHPKKRNGSGEVENNRCSRHTARGFGADNSNSSHFMKCLRCGTTLSTLLFLTPFNLLKRVDTATILP